MRNLTEFNPLCVELSLATDSSPVDATLFAETLRIGPMRRQIAFISTGGTLASFHPSSTAAHGYEDGGHMLSARDLLLQLVPPAHIHPESFISIDGVEVIPFDLPPMLSDAMGPAEWHEIGSTVERLASDGLDGLVVGHGTATLEETAYALNLTLELEIPVVLTGAMRPLSALDSDALRNLAAAIKVAADPASKGRGVLVVLNNEIHAAREVEKRDTSSLGAFRSELGPLGRVDDVVVFFRSTERRHYPDTRFNVEMLARFPKVDITYSYAGCDGTAVKAFIAARSRGIVSAGFAPGGSSPAEEEALEEAIRLGFVVVQSTRTGGAVIRSDSMKSKGIVSAGDLSPQKARILLGVAFSFTDDAEVIQGMFNEH